jgi:hypothetical protein
MTQLAKLSCALLLAALPACAAAPAPAQQPAAPVRTTRVVDAEAAWTVEGFGGVGYTQVIVHKREPRAAGAAARVPVAAR